MTPNKSLLARAPRHAYDLSNKGRKNHSWGTIQASPHPDDNEIVCRNCGLRERERFLLDDDGRPARGCVWTTSQGQILAVRPYAYSSNSRPANRPTQTWSQAYPGVPVTRRPECPKSPTAWSSSQAGIGA